MNRNSAARTVIFHIAAAGLGILAMMPFLWMISTALKDSGAIITIPIQWIPRKPGLDNFVNIFKKDGIFRSMMNSFLVSLGSVGTVLVSSAMAAFAFAKIKFRGREILFLVYLAVLMIPSQVLFIPMYLLMSELGLTDSLWALVLPNVIRVFAVFMLRQQMLSIPDAFLEAAAIDGASLFRQFIQIMVPMCRTTFITLFIISFMDAWNDFLMPLVMLTSRHNYTLPIILNSLSGIYKTEVNLLMAGALISMLPIIILYGAAQKYFAGGLQLGGIKG